MELTFFDRRRRNVLRPIIGRYQYNNMEMSAAARRVRG